MYYDGLMNSRAFVAHKPKRGYPFDKCCKLVLDAGFGWQGKGSMNIYKHINHRILQAIKGLQNQGKLSDGLALERVEAVPPKDAAHGDIATNAAMIVAAQAKMNPRQVAELLLPEIRALQEVRHAEIAGPGFINVSLKPDVWQKIIPVILKEGVAFGDSTIGRGEKVNVEYVSANPTGPMHVGHGRGAAFGDALSSLLKKAGYHVTKEYYINDAGAQIDKLAESAFLRYREALGEVIGEIPAGLYPGEYLISVGTALAAVFGDALKHQSREEWLPTVRDFVTEAMLAMIKDDLAALGIHHDVFTSERMVVASGLVDEALKKLGEKELVYVGVLEPPKGKAPDDWEPRPQTLFRSTAFGDDCDRALKKSDGSWTYLTPDIGYHYDKCNRGFTRMINVLGADHAGYVKRISAAVTALSDGKATLEVKLCQLVKFLRAGEPLKMSKRAGTFVTVREVVDEVGKDVFRFIMLTRKNDAPLDFDFEKVMEQSKDNPVFYVQYAHARAKSVMRNAEAEFPGIVAAAQQPEEKSLARLQHEDEMSLIRLMAGWPRIVESAAVAGEPHRVAFYLQELAAGFHALWNRGNDDIALRFILKHDIELTQARVSLIAALATVIASGLHLLGVQPMDEMR